MSQFAAPITPKWGEQLLKEAIEQVLGVPALTNGRDEIATLLKTAQKQQAKDLAQVAGLERHAEQQALLQEKQQALETDLGDLRSKLTGTRDEREALEDELEAVDSIHRAKIRLDVLLKRQKEILEEQKNKRAQRLILIRDAWRDILDAKLTIRRQQLFEEQRELTGHIERRSSLETRIEQLRKLLSTGRCPTCGQDMHAD